MEDRLFRPEQDRIISGVCGGIGRYLGIDSTLVRLFFALGVLFFAISPLFYIVLWIIMPNEATLYHKPAALPAQPQDPTGEWKYDPYTGEPLHRNAAS